MNDKVRALLQFYDEGIAANGVTIRKHDNPLSKRERLEHLRWMIIELLAGRDDPWSDRKVNRWLGFIQGTLQAEGMVSIPMLRDHSRDLYTEEEGN